MARIVELDVPVDNVSGYAVFDGGVLRRAVFINLDAWLSSMEAAGDTRPVVHIDLGFAAANVTSSSAAKVFSGAKVQVRRLGIDHADDIANLTWAGQSYEDSSDASPTGQEVVEAIDAEDGVDLQASEAVLLSFDFWLAPRK